MEKTMKERSSESYPNLLEDGRVVKDFDEVKFCQSCGMPLTDEVLGTNADGSKNEDYCMYCYKDGKFLLGPDIQAVVFIRQETTIISENDMDAINFTIFAKIFAITHCYSNYYLYLCERNPRIILETTNNTNN